MNQSMTLFTDLRTRLNNSKTRQKVVIPSLIVSAPACFFATPANALTFTSQMKILLKTIKTHCFSALPSPFALGAIAVTVFGAWVSNPAQAAVITFDNLISGQTSFGFDGDGDSISDVVFSTTDASGFNVIGPGVNQQFINEPGLEGSTLLNPDLRVDFTFGTDLSKSPISFGLAMSTLRDFTSAGNFSLFDSQGNLIEKIVFGILQGSSSFPESLVSSSVNAGIISYGLFDFDDASTFASRYIIDNFTGEFGSTERPIDSVPGPLPLFGAGAAFITSRKLRKRIKSFKLPIASTID